MSRWHGRIRLSLLLVIGLLVAVVASNQLLLGWGQSSVARQAMVTALAQLPRQAPAVADEPQVAGRDATAEETAALDQTANAFLAAIRERDADASWKLLAPSKLGERSREEWAEDLEPDAEETYGAGQDAVLLMMSDHPKRVGEVEVAGDSGVGRVNVTVTTLLWLALVRQGDKWLVDLEGLEKYRARQALQGNLQSISSQNWMQAVMSMTGGVATPDYLALSMLSPKTATHQVAWRKVDGDAALVKLDAQVVIGLEVPLERQAGKWSVSWEEAALLADPTAPMTGQPVAKACLSNLRQLATAMFTYAQDYDEKLPPADKWSTGTFPYTMNTKLYQCPAVLDKPGYAMNYKLSRFELTKVKLPTQTVMHFDSTLLRENAFDYKDAGESAAWPPRHANVINYSFADGHASSEPYPLEYPHYYQVGAKQARPEYPRRSPMFGFPSQD